MRFFYACQTDKGVARFTNQDSLLVKSVGVDGSAALLTAVCDGVGGLSRGEITSRQAAKMLGNWAEYELLHILETDRSGEVLKRRFQQQFLEINKEIFFGNKRNGISSGTTMTALLLWENRYLLGHVGDSRAYAVTREVHQLSEDHSWVAGEVAAGRMTEEEAKYSTKKNVILRCIGADEDIEPQFLGGRIHENTVFVLCTDGFWHHVEMDEMLRYFSPESVVQENRLGEILYYLSSQVKLRGESDNITAVAVKACPGGHSPGNQNL